MQKATILRHPAYPIESPLVLGTAKSGFLDRSAVIIVTFLSVLIFIFSSDPAFGHGGKYHTEDAVTKFQVLKKATVLYDRLLIAGKLDESWETSLEAIRVSVSDANEYVVSFQRDDGDPSTVYFFFDSSGKYAGSNFTGP